MRNLCKCGHTVEEHTAYTKDSNGWMVEYLVSCGHDQAIFKGMCICGAFREVDNLMHIELLAKQKGLV